MAIITTGSTVIGLVKGLPRTEVVVSGTNIIVPDMIIVNGNPDGVVTSNIAGLIAYNIATGSNFMAKTTGGSTWFNIGSVAAA
jgi:hypothetical protein